MHITTTTAGDTLLLSLTVNNFTLVEHLHTEFQPGMTAITGETGAGKSLILDALGMALGDRGDTSRIRRGKDKLDVTALFSVAANPRARAWLEHYDLLNGEECLLRRTLNSEGRSRGFINGQPATMQQLQQLGEMMIDIHSQHEHQSLLVRETHRTLLDDFCGAQPLAAKVSQLFREWQETRSRLATLQGNAGELEARRALLRFQLEELDQLALAADELEQLEREQRVLANGEQILRDSHQVLALCREGDDGDILSLLARAQHLLHVMPDKSNHLSEAEALLDSAIIQVDEASREIQRHIDSFDVSPERLQEVEARLALVYQLARKHRVHPSELPTLHRSLAEELDALGGASNNLDTLVALETEQEQALTRAAAELSKKRARAAGEFSALVNGQLQSLAMSAASLDVRLTPEQAHTSHGRELVEFLVRTNPGQPHMSLNRVASGGELSRLSLAIQVIAARHTTIPTLVFDEVDVGVGGAVAEVVGRLLRELGEKGQVICVTHLPQVASCAHHHLIASKTTGEESAESELNSIAGKQRISEIARMLGGTKITRQTLAHAEEMLNLSAQGE